MGEWDNFGWIFKNTLCPMAIIKALRGEDGRIVDYIVLNTNKSYRSLMNIPENVLEQYKSVKDIISKVYERQNINLIFEKIQNILKSGAPKELIQEFPTLNKKIKMELIPKDNDVFAVILKDITEESKLRKKISKTKEKLNTAISSSNIGLWDWEIQTGKVEFNEEWAKMLGFSLDDLEFNYKEWEKRVHPNDLSETLDRLNEHLEGKTPKYRSIHRLKTRDGTWRWILDTGKVVEWDDNGDPVRAVGTHSDITDYMEMQKRQLETEKKYKRLMEAAPIGVGVVVDKHLVFLNREGLDIMDANSLEEINQKEVFEYVHPEDRPKAKQRVNSILEKGGKAPPIHEKFYTTKNRLIYVRITSVPITYENKKAVQIIFKDITSTKKVQKHLKETMDMLKSIFELSPIGIVITDMELNIIDCNKAAIKIFEVEKKFNLIGKAALNLVEEKDKSKAEKYLNKTLEKGITRGISYDISTFNGKERKIELSSALLKNSDDEPIGFIGNLIDITEKERMKQRLFQSQKLESLGVLSSGIAHDFNNLMMAILGNADLALLDLSKSSPVKQYLNDIKKGAKNAAEVSKQLLAYSGKGQFVITKINITKLVDEMLSLIKVSISNKANLHLALQKDLPLVKVDKTQIRQIIMNLLTNASDALEDKPGEIVIRTGTRYCNREFFKNTYLNTMLKPGKYVFLEVTDTGVGMDKETKKRLFDPFFTTKFTGRGLGLAATLGIVKSHEGTIQIETKKGQGSTFRIFLPVIDSEEPSDPLEVKKNDEKFTNRNIKLAKTVLLVDDEPAVRRVGEKMLKKLGFKVIQAVDGKKGLNIFKEKRDIVDIVLLDLTMPNMDGKETFNRLKNIDSTVKIILSSGYNKQSISNKFSKHKVDGFIQKPYNVNDLKETIHHILRE